MAPSCSKSRRNQPIGPEIHGRSSLVIAAMCKDLAYDELFFVLLSDVLRIDLSRVEDKGSQIVNMSFNLFASN